MSGDGEQFAAGTRGECEGSQEKQLDRAPKRAHEARAGLGDGDFGRGGRAEAQSGMRESEVENGLIALVAERGAEQVHVVGHGDRSEGAFDLQTVHRRGELVIGAAKVSVARRIGVALASGQMGAGEADVLQ